MANKIALIGTQKVGGVGVNKHGDWNVGDRVADGDNRPLALLSEVGPSSGEDWQKFPLWLYRGSVAASVTTWPAGAPYAIQYDVDIPLISVAAYRSHVELAPGPQTSLVNTGISPGVPSASEGMVAGFLAQYSTYIDKWSAYPEGIQVYWDGVKWCAQVYGTVRHNYTGGPGYMRLDHASRGGSWNRTNYTGVSFSELVRNYLLFQVFSTDSFTSLMTYWIGPIAAFPAMYVDLRGHLFVSGDILYMKLRHYITLGLAGSGGAASFRYETRTHGKV